MKQFILMLLLVAISGCTQHTYLKPNGKIGFVSTNGCGTLPNWFIYEDRNSRYSVSVYRDALFLDVEVLEKDDVRWANDTINVTIDGEKHSFRAKELMKYGVLRSPCGGFAERLNCKQHQRYNIWIEIPNVESAEIVVVDPPIPAVNGEPIGVSRIEFRPITETLFSGINC